MRFFAFSQNGTAGLAVENGDRFNGLLATDPAYPGDLRSILEKGGSALSDAAKALSSGKVVDPETATFLPPISNADKIVCVGLNYRDHAAEGGFQTPDYPTLFGRFNSSLIGHNAPIIRPKVSHELDYEGELVAVIGKGGKKIAEKDALDHVAGYSIFNDGSIRDYQIRAPQWTAGKNFDDSGAFGPYFITSDALPAGCAGLQLTTRLNGEVVQSASTDDMVFSVAALVSILSEFMTLNPGDVIVTGTPSGVGFVRKPPLFMKDGDVCEVEIEGLGILRNPVKNEAA
jgi:acylpyruvate hydrolase